MLRNNNLDSTLYRSIKHLIEEARKRVVRNINKEMVVMYFEIGRQIVQEDQMGKIRADYAKSILGQLSKRLTEEFGRGYSVDNLENCRRFYLAYEMRISETVSRKLETPPSILGTSFLLSWSHYVQLIKIQNSNERQFYEIEAHKNSWSLRELQRQINSSLYERVAISKDKHGLERLSKEGQIIELPTDVLKSHYVLEFLDLKEDNRYSESDFETAIINKLEHFMLEMGKGFLFGGRQKRFTFESDSYYVDLVFYNRLLKCFVLLDLKIGKLAHQDIGQMQMYVNYYDRRMKTSDENPTVGIVLCKEENKTVVEFTLPENNKTIFAKEYKLYLPSKEELKKQLK